MSLLQEALSLQKKQKHEAGKGYTPQQVELALAWRQDQVSYTPIKTVMELGKARTFIIFSLLLCARLTGAARSMWGRIKRRHSDSLFSQYLRLKRKYRCEYCEGFFPQGRGLTVSHFWTRAKESVRFDEENCDILCIRDHAYFESHETEYGIWKKTAWARRRLIS